MKKYEKPRFEPFKIGLSSGVGCSNGSTPGNMSDGICQSGTFALVKKCQSGLDAGRKCSGGTAPNCKSGNGG